MVIPEILGITILAVFGLERLLARTVHALQELR